VKRVRLRDGRSLAVHPQGSGAPALLVHGFTGSQAAWRPEVIDGLAEHRRVLAVDLIGHGASDRPHEPERYALSSVVDDLCQVLDAFEVPSAPWIGYSMGGRIALGAAVLRPERVESLVLEGTSPGLESEPERAQRRTADAALAAQLELGDLEAFVDGWMRQPLFATQSRLPARLRAAQREGRLRNDARALAACLRGLGTGTQPSFWENLPELEQPTLLLAGALDEKFRAVGARMAAALPHPRLAVIDGAGHAVNLEQPKAYVEAVRAFLNPQTERTEERKP
jgi:2-succinyl-6-hydroxy-2,4-cyclohexadiene-1-carboxylate synthase